MITSIEQGQQPGENYSAAGISLHLFQVSAPFFITKRQTYEGQKEKANKKRCRETPGVLYI
jgi:hypothetical protein